MKYIIGIIVGIIISIPLTAFAKTVVLSADGINVPFRSGTVQTVKIQTEEGTYRVFIHTGGGIHAIRL